MSLKEERRKAGLSQLALANRAGVCRATIINYETGRRTPKVEILKRICDTLGVPMKDLIEDV